MSKAALLAQIAKDPKRMNMLVTALADPRRAIEALNLMISRESDLEAIRRLQGVRDALERFGAEDGGAP